MLKYLLIAFVIALAVAPLAHFLPSKRQRAVAGIREYAAVHGLFVEFRHAPSRQAAPATVRDVVYYGKRLPASRPDNIQPAAWSRDEHGWRSVGPRRPVPPPLEALSVDVLGASVDQFSCGVYWRETEGEEAVEQIRQVLERWCELLIQ